MARGNDDESGRGRHSIESWWRDDPPPPVLVGPLLAGASLLYRAGRALHRGLYAAGLKRRRRLPIPVASIGNVTVGGAGKTPFVDWLARALTERGRRVVVVGRGYGRPPGARLNDEGDWLERAQPGLRVVQDPDRFRAASAALASAPADLLLLDDGFQHEPLARQLDVVLVDAHAPFGNRRLLPRGPLREPLAALRRARFVFATRAELAGDGEIERLRCEIAALAPQARFGVVRFEIGALRRGATREPATSLRDRPIVLMSGVARPDSVRATARRLGARVADELVFPDHHLFTRADLDRARARAAALSADLVVTAKDAVKLDLLGDPGSYLVLEQAVVVTEGGEELLAELAQLSSASSP